MLLEAAEAQAYHSLLTLTSSLKLKFETVFSIFYLCVLFLYACILNRHIYGTR